MRQTKLNHMRGPVEIRHQRQLRGECTHARTRKLDSFFVRCCAACCSPPATLHQYGTARDQGHSSCSQSKKRNYTQLVGNLCQKYLQQYNEPVACVTPCVSVVTGVTKRTLARKNSGQYNVQLQMLQISTKLFKD